MTSHCVHDTPPIPRSSSTSATPTGRSRAIAALLALLLASLAWSGASAQASDPPSATEPDDPATSSVTPDATDPQATAAASASGVPELDIAPLDFCALAPKHSAGAFERQRVVMLDVAEDPTFDSAPEVEVVKRGKETVEVKRSVIRSIQPFEHAREVLMSVFPMKRLYLVLAPETPTAVFDDKKPISVASAQALLSTDLHVAYSVECADWLAVPYMTRGKAVWTQQEREKTVIDGNGKSHIVKYRAWDVSVPLTARLEVYRRSGDAFVHHATLKARPQGTAAEDALHWDDPQDLHETVSVTMPPGCITSGMSRAEVAAALPRCGGNVPRISPAEGSPTLGGFVRGSHYCSNLDDVVRTGGANMPAIARCELRVSAEYLAVDLQLQGKRMCGWRLFSPLLDVPNSTERGVSMGAHEGAERGSYYVAYGTAGQGGCGDDEQEQGYGRLTTIGPGGELGFEQPSIVHFQAGHPQSGVRMEELAMHGLRFGVRPAAALVLAKGDLESSFAAGALLEGGYDLTRFVGLLDESWIKADVGLLFGDETFLPISVSFETASYVADRLAIFGDLGFALTVVSKSLETGTFASSNVTVTGSSFGGRVAVGLNYSIRPEWNARLIVEARSGFGSTTLKNEDKLPGFEVDGGQLLLPMLSLGTSYTY